MNNYLGLTCKFNAPSDKVDFMDLTISIKNGQISTSLFEKPLNLHLYIPPHSDHPPGLLPGIVHSTLFQLFTVGSDPNDQILRMKVFLNGYRHEVTRATKLNLSFLMELPVLKVTLDHPTQQTMSTQRSYSTYHSIPMTHHHTKFNRHVATQSHPPNTICPCLTCATQNKKCDIEHMIIAYCCPMIIGNLLSHCNLNINSTALPVSSYYPYD